MIYKSPLIKGKFLKRYKRFFADIEIDGLSVVAHVPNTGSMKTCIAEDATCYLTQNSNPKRKLKWTLEQMVIERSRIGVNTGISNALVYEAWDNNLIPHWSKYGKAQKEVKVSSESRLDMALWSEKDFPELDKIKPDFIASLGAIKKKTEIKNISKYPKLHFIEIKNVTMAIGSVARFPDSVTNRGTKHIQELGKLMKQGHSCEMVYVIQREGIQAFEIAAELDPTYDSALKVAVKEGLKVTALKVEFKKNETKIVGLL